MITSRPQQIPAHLRGDFARASVVGRDEIGGWWLMSNSADEIFCCFNPLLETPNVIELLGNKKKKRPRPTKAAFSAPPTDPDWMVLVVHGGEGCHNSFSTLLRREGWWTNYEIGFVKGRICAGIGCRGGKFWCLFDTGEVLIFEIDGCDDGLWRRRTVIMMGAARSLTAERFRGINYLCTAVKLDGGCAGVVGGRGRL